MTSPYDQIRADVAAAEAADQAKDAALAAAATQHTADQATIAELEAELNPTPPQTGTLFGVNASTKAEHDANAALLAPKVWRYYQNPGEPLAWPKEYTLGPGESLAYSDKVSITDKIAGKADAAFTAFCKAAPTDRPTWYSPLHEHDAKIAQGQFTATQYVTAFQRLAAIAHATNPMVRMTVIYTDWCFKPASGRNWRDTWPGDVADVLGIDAYIGAKYTALSGLPGVFDSVTAAAQAVGRPWGVFETGVDIAYTAAHRLAGLTALAALARAKGAQVVCYFALYNWVMDATAAKAWQAGQTG